MYKRQVYTIDRSPKIKGSNLSGETSKTGKTGASKRVMNTGKKSYRKSTIHQTEDVKKGRISKYRKNIKEANTSIKTKNTTLRNAGMVGAKTMTCLLYTSLGESGRIIPSGNFLLCLVRGKTSKEKF